MQQTRWQPLLSYNESLYEFEETPTRDTVSGHRDRLSKRGRQENIGAPAGIWQGCLQLLGIHNRRILPVRAPQEVHGPLQLGPQSIYACSPVSMLRICQKTLLLALPAFVLCLHSPVEQHVANISVHMPTQTRTHCADSMQIHS